MRFLGLKEVLNTLVLLLELLVDVAHLLQTLLFQFFPARRLRIELRILIRLGPATEATFQLVIDNLDASHNVVHHRTSLGIAAELDAPYQRVQFDESHHAGGTTSTLPISNCIAGESDKHVEEIVTLKNDTGEVLANDQDTIVID